MPLKDYIKENLSFDVNGAIEKIYNKYFVEPIDKEVTGEYKVLNVLLGENSKLLWARELDYGEVKWIVCCIDYVLHGRFHHVIGYLHLIYDNQELYHIEYMKNFDDIIKVHNECAKEYRNYIKHFWCSD